MKRKLSGLLALIMLISVILPSRSYADSGVSRVFGSNRYETAVEISKASYDKADAIVVASGEGFADALAGGGLANAVDGPILLVKKTSVPDAVIKEVQRLGAKKIYLLGGASTISSGVEAQLKKYASVERLSGSNRYETSIAITKKVLSIVPEAAILVANGSGFADALSAGGYIAKKGAALVLTDGKTASTSLMALKDDVKEFIVLGGINSVSNQLQSRLGANRLSGSNRYETAIAIANAAFDSIENAVIVDGMNYPDGLTSIALAKISDAPILLVSKNSISNNVVNLLQVTINITIVGGGNSVGTEVEKKLNEVIKSDGEETEQPIEDPKPDTGENYIEYKGKLTFDGQKDTYEFTAIRSGVHAFSLTDLATGAYTDLMVYNQNDQRIVNCDTYGKVHLTAGESYSVSVINEGKETGYTLKIYYPNPVYDLTNSLEIEADLRFDGQEDIYTFTAKNSGVHGFKLSQLATGAYTDIYVYNASDQRILNRDTFGTVQLTAGEKYEIYVVNEGKATGYKLTIYEANPVHDLSDQLSAVGQLRFDGQRDIYTFTAKKDGKHEFKLTELASGAYTDLWVYNKHDQIIVDRDTVGSATLQSGDTYWIYVVNEGKETGYKLTITGP